MSADARPFFPSARGLPKAFWVLWTGMLVNRIGAFVMPFLAIYLTEERGFSVANAGFMVALFGAGSLASGPIGGALADRIGRRPMLVFGLALGAAAMTNLAVARAPTHIALATLLLGFLGDLYRPAVAATVADLIPEADRPRAYGLLYWAVNIGFSIAPVVAGVMARRGFMILFAGDIATTLACAAIVALYVPETRPQESAAHEGPRDSARQKPPYRDGVFMAFVATTLLVGCIFHQAMAPLPLDMARNGITPAEFGGLMAINGVLIVIFQPFSIRVLGRFKRERVLAWSALLTGVGFGAVVVARTLPVYAITIVLWTLGEIAMAPIGPAVVADLAPVPRRGAYQGAYQLAFGGSMFIGPAIGGWMLGRFDPSFLWGACLFAGIAGAIGYLVVGGWIRERAPAGAEIATTR